MSAKLKVMDWALKYNVKLSIVTDKSFSVLARDVWNRHDSCLFDMYNLIDYYPSSCTGGSYFLIKVSNANLE